ncbi:MAG: hypothetical protein ABIP94_10720 [Planctomycetota bacterium]
MPQHSEGILLQFSVSRSRLDFRGAQAGARDGRKHKLEALVRNFGAVMSWPNARDLSDLRLEIPYAGAIPYLKSWRWTGAGTAANAAAETPAETAEKAAAETTEPVQFDMVGQDEAREILAAAPSPAELILNRLARARALAPTHESKAAFMFFAELDMATNENLLGAPGSVVTPARIALVARETETIQKRLIRLAAKSRSLATAPTWSGMLGDRDAIVDIMLPLMDHFGAGAAFDSDKLADAFYKFAAGELRDDRTEPLIGGPDSANILCFAGFALRAMSAAGAAVRWGAALPVMVRAAGVYFACLQLPADSYWSSFGQPTLPKPADLEGVFTNLRLPLSPKAQVIKGLGILIATFMPNQVNADFGS